MLKKWVQSLGLEDTLEEGMATHSSVLDRGTWWATVHRVTKSLGHNWSNWNQDCWEKYQQPQICRWHHPYGTKWRGTKKPLDEREEESEKVGLKLNIQKTKIMASGPITSWEIDGETVETVSDFIFWSSKITAHGDCSHEIKRCLFLGRKVMTNLDRILKSRDIVCQQRSV